MNTIIEQLKDFCDCLPDMDDSIYERNVRELIDLISNLTCWTQEPCETFLNSERQETMDLQKFDRCSCDGGIVEFKPYYTPFQPDTFKVYLVEQNGIHETSTELDPSSYAYAEILDALRIDVKDYVKFNDCKCPSVYKLLIKYDAGYELIPDCLLQLFCDVLHVIADKNNCDCSACQACKGDDEKDEVEIEYSEGDNISPKLSSYLNSLVEAGYKKQLGLISLCGRGCTSGIWGAVI